VEAVPRCDRSLGPNIIIVAYPARDGRHVLIPVTRATSACSLNDGRPRTGYATRAKARRNCHPGQHTYLCSCGKYHNAVARPLAGAAPRVILRTPPRRPAGHKPHCHDGGRPVRDNRVNPYGDD